MKVYVLIYANAEGYNFLGVFDTLGAAEKVCDRINEAGRKYLRDLYHDDPAEMKRSLEFYDWWDKCDVVEWEMNTANEPMQEEPDQP